MAPSILEEALQAGIDAGNVARDAASGVWHVRDLAAGRAVMRSRACEPAPLEHDPRDGIAALPSGLQSLVRRGMALHDKWIIANPEQHRRLRPIMAAPIGAASIAAIEPWLRGEALGLLDALPDDPRRRLDFADAFPRVVSFRLLGVPEALWPAIDGLIGSLMGFVTDSEATTRGAAMGQAAFADRLAAMLDAPAPGEAVLLRAVQQAARDGRIDRDDAIGVISTLLLAGGTTVAALRRLIDQLLATPDLARELSDGSREWAPVIEEALRFAFTMANRPRITLHDVVLRDGVIPAGSRIALDLNAMNLDPNGFSDPGRFDPERRGTAHISFGAGLHHCVGRHLARMQLRVGAAAFLETLPQGASA